MADTQGRIFPTLDPPKSKVRAVVLIIPAKRSDAILTLGKQLSGPEQFQARVRQIGEMAPWISAAPYFARYIAELLKPRASN